MSFSSHDWYNDPIGDEEDTEQYGTEDDSKTSKRQRASADDRLVSKRKQAEVSSVPQSIISKTVIASCRISSANRINQNDPRNAFSVMITPPIQRAMGFYVSSCYIINSWFNIVGSNTANVNGSNNVSYWQITGGSVFQVIVPVGQYGAGTFAAQMQVLLTAGAGLSVGANNISFFLNGLTNRFNWSYLEGGTTTNALTYLPTATYGGNPVVSTAGPVMGFLASQSSSYQSSGTSPNLVSGENQVNFLDYPVIAVGSSQLRRPISIDSRQGGSGNCFLHLENTANKSSPIRYQNYAPTELSIIKYSGPQDFGLVQLSVTDPSTGKGIDIAFDWEIVLHFLTAP